MMDGKKLVEVAKWAKAKQGPPEACYGCPLENEECVIGEVGGCYVSPCEVADAILAAYEWGRAEAIEQAANALISLGLEKLGVIKDD